MFKFNLYFFAQAVCLTFFFAFALFALYAYLSASFDYCTIYALASLASAYIALHDVSINYSQSS